MEERWEIFILSIVTYGVGCGCGAGFRYGAHQLHAGKETSSMATPRSTLTHLAQQAAAQIGFTVRRWWREKTEPAVLRVEVERRLVGALPAALATHCLRVAAYAAWVLSHWYRLRTARAANSRALLPLSHSDGSA